jgi:hypothetical protein
MTALNTANNFASPDDFYERLIDAHRDLTTEQSHAMNAALVLLLANHIGDMQVIEQAFTHARQTAQTTV